MRCCWDNDSVIPLMEVLLYLGGPLSHYLQVGATAVTEFSNSTNPSVDAAS